MSSSNTNTGDLHTTVTTESAAFLKSLFSPSELPSNSQVGGFMDNSFTFLNDVDKNLYNIIMSVYGDLDGKEVLPGTFAYDFSNAEFYKDYANIIRGRSNKGPFLHWCVVGVFIRLILTYPSGLRIPIPKFNNFSEYSANINNNIVYFTNNSFPQGFYNFTSNFSHLDLAKLMTHRFKQHYTSKVERKQIDTSKLKDDYNCDPATQQIFRTDNGNFMRQGMKFPIQAGTDCFGIGITDHAKCVRLIADCQGNPNDKAAFERCKAHFSGFNSFDITSFKGTVQEMHPTVALKLLKSFGVKKCEVYSDEYHRTIYRIQSLEEWFNNLPKDIKDQVHADETFYRVVNILISYMNCHPGILNKGFSDEDIKEYTKYYPSNNFATNKFNIQKKTTSCDKKGNTITFYRTQAAIQHMPTPNVAFLPPPQVTVTPPPQHFAGNGVHFPGTFQFGQSGGYAHTLTINETDKIGSAFVKAQLDHAIDQLRARGQILDRSLITTLNGHITEMEQHEEKVVKYLTMIEEFRKMLPLDAKKDYLTKDKLDKLIGKGNSHSKSTTTAGKAVMAAIQEILCKSGITV